MELSLGRNENDDMSEVSNNNRRQNVNNGGPEGLEIRVRRMHFIPFVTGDHNSISIVNYYTHIFFCLNHHKVQQNAAMILEFQWTQL